MTINHIFVLVSASRLNVLRSFYRTALQPLGYTEMITVDSQQVYGYGSDYPYLWLKALPKDQTPTPTHIAIDAINPSAVDNFYKAAIDAGGIDNGKPGIRPEMSRQPYYSAFIRDTDGNNIEAVYVEK